MPDLLMMSMNFSDIVILNIKDVDYGCFISEISTSEARNLCQFPKKYKKMSKNINLTKKSGTL